MRSSRTNFILAVLMTLPLVAAADCYIGGYCEAALNTETPEMGVWKYTLTVDWDSGNPHALSHLDLLLGFEDHSCECEEFLFGFDDPAGDSESWEDGRCCTVYYEGYFECHGDPSIPNVFAPLIKFEPIEVDCEPGPTGTGIFIFYTDWEPEAVETPNDYLLFKAGQTSCFGELTGELPVLGCETVAADESSWGQVKSQF